MAVAPSSDLETIAPATGAELSLSASQGEIDAAATHGSWSAANNHPEVPDVVAIAHHVGCRVWSMDKTQDAEIGFAEALAGETPSVGALAALRVAEHRWVLAVALGHVMWSRRHHEQIIEVLDRNFLAFRGDWSSEDLQSAYVVAFAAALLAPLSALPRFRNGKQLALVLEVPDAVAQYRLAPPPWHPLAGSPTLRVAANRTRG